MTSTDCIYFAVRNVENGLYYNRTTNIFDKCKEDASLVTFEEVINLKLREPNIEHFIHENT
jgi:hypothetical protein